jgi:hypothetical protein
MSSDPSASPMRPSDLMVDDEVRLAAEIDPPGASAATLDASPHFAVGDRVQRDRNGIVLEVTGVRGVVGRGDDIQLNHRSDWVPAESVRPTDEASA